MIAPEQDRFMVAASASEAYYAGLSLSAAHLFEKAARMAQDAGDVHNYIHLLRWAGNAYIWAFRHDDAYPYLLETLSHDRHPEVSVSDIYTAFTDLALLAVRHRTYAKLNAILADSREFLERRHLEAWGHRLDLIQAMGHMRRGEFDTAYAVCSKAWQGLMEAADGPRYQYGAYLNIMFRSALGAGSEIGMDRTLSLFGRHSETHIAMSRLRHGLARALRLQFRGLDEDGRVQLDCLLRELLGIMKASEWARDEALTTCTLLSSVGRQEEAADVLRRAQFFPAIDVALAELDIAHGRLQAVCAQGRASLSNQVRLLLSSADQHAAAENNRLECTRYAQLVAERRQRIEPLLEDPT